MVSVCFYFQVHQPLRVRKYSIFDIGKNNNYFSDNSETSLNNVKVLRKVSEKCYIPMNALLLELLEKHPEFKVSFSFSGVYLEQLEKHAPEVLLSFKKLVDTGRVEILGETYYHSLSFLFSKGEFFEQVKKHEELIQRIFGKTPRVFRNTELIYNNELAKNIEGMGYIGIIAEGAPFILGWRSPNYIYSPVNTQRIKLILKNYKMSDDIAFRFSERNWAEWPLTASKYAQWINSVNGGGEMVNLFMDYETFGEHQWESTGIFDFMRQFPEEILKNPDNNFKTPSELAESYPSRGVFDSPGFISWADIERDLSAWLGNEIQNAAIKKVYSLGFKILKTQNSELIDKWRKLQTSDHFYYMCTKWFSDGDVHKYFNPYQSPYDAFISYMNVLQDLELRTDEILNEKKLSVGKFKSNIYKENSLTNKRGDFNGGN
ncbi:MAG: glycoside hydrolase family 57 protein [Nanoarchaeota archaeon]|nr:glycoside hydrolase family 57 protein [Nanoarchaeota archaeon]